MKFKLILLSILIPVFSIGQSFEFDLHSDTVKTQNVFSGFEFEYELVNNTGSDLDLKWRLFADFTDVPSWEDNICEGVIFCHTTAIRSNEFTLASDGLDVYHHIEVYADSGTGYSTLCVFDPTDSANTVECHTMTATAIWPDTLPLTVSGQEVYIIDGDTFEIYGGEYVPLGLESVDVSFVGLSQNAPNPFRENTRIEYTLENEEGILRVHNTLGKLVKEVQLTTRHGRVTLGEHLNAGVYFYSLWENGQMIDSKRMQVIN